MYWFISCKDFWHGKQAGGSYLAWGWKQASGGLASAVGGLWWVIGEGRNNDSEC